MRPVREVPLSVSRSADLEIGIGVARQDERRKLIPFGLAPGDNLLFDVYRDAETFFSTRVVEVVHGDYPTALITARASLIPKVGTYRYRMVLQREGKKHLLAHGPFTVSD